MVKARNENDKRCRKINVPLTWTQGELESYLRLIYGAATTQPLNLTLGGRLLQEPLSKLCDSNISPYSLLTFDSASLFGGSEKAEDDE